MHSKLGSIFLLSIAPIIWGLGFIGTRWVLVDYSATWCHALRFCFCLPIIIPFLLYKKTFLSWKNYVKPGLILGFFLSMGLWTQTIGIARTTVAKAGFFTVFYAFFTPFLAMVLLKKRYKNFYWVLVCVAVLGISFLCELKITNFNIGDGYILLSALFFSLHILLVDKYATKESDSLQINFIQTFMIALLSLIIALAIEPIPSLSSLFDWSAVLKPSALSGMLMISLFSTIIAFSIQVYAQKFIEPHIASLIFLLESISAAFFGYVFFQEKLNAMGAIGAFLVLLAVALIPLTFKSVKKKENL